MPMLFGNKFCLKKRSRLVKVLDNRFYVKFMQLDIVLFKEAILTYLFNYIYNLFTGKRASKDYKRSLQRQVSDEVKKTFKQKARINSNH